MYYDHMFRWPLLQGLWQALRKANFSAVADILPNDHHLRISSQLGNPYCSEKWQVFQRSVQEVNRGLRSANNAPVHLTDDQQLSCYNPRHKGQVRNLSGTFPTCQINLYMSEWFQKFGTRSKHFREVRNLSETFQRSEICPKPVTKLVSWNAAIINRSKISSVHAATNQTNKTVVGVVVNAARERTSLWDGRRLRATRYAGRCVQPCWQFTHYIQTAKYVGWRRRRWQFHISA